MVTSEREMVRKLDVDEEAPEKVRVAERSGSLQPTYEDSIVPDPDDWELDE